MSKPSSLGLHINGLGSLSWKLSGPLFNSKNNVQTKHQKKSLSWKLSRPPKKPTPIHPSYSLAGLLD